MQTELKTTTPTKENLPTVDELLASPGVSFWLKDALRSALQRDCLGALADAELLAAVLAEITNRQLGGQP